MDKTYKLKPGQETIEIVDGPMAGKKFERGKTYSVVPENEKHRFEAVVAAVGAKNFSPLQPPNVAPARDDAPDASAKPQAPKPAASDNLTAPYAIEPDSDPDRKNGYKIVKR